MTEPQILWEIISHAGKITGIFLFSWITASFLKPFVLRKESANAAGLGCLAGLLFAYLCPWTLSGAASYLIADALLLAALCLLDRRNFRQKLFLAMLCYLLPWIVHSATVLSWSFFFENLMYADEIMANPWLHVSLFAVLEVFYCAVRAVLLRLLTRMIIRFYLYKKEELSGREFMLLLLPALPGLAGYWLFSYLENLFFRESGENLWDICQPYDWFLLLYQAVSFGAVCASVVALQKIKRTGQEEKENAVLSGQMEDMRRHIAQIEKIYADVRNLRHDVNSHLATLEKLYQEGSGESSEYARALSESLDPFFFPIKSGNPVTDVILEEKSRAAREKGIDFRCGFYYPEHSRVDTFDLSVILNNALSNAIEYADGESPFVQISARRRKNAFLVEIQNSFSGDIVRNEDGLPETTKADKSVHGCGLANIRRIARKYRGEISFEAENGRAVLTVLLMPEWKTAYN